VTAKLDGGRFGPVFAGRDPLTNRSVLIRTFDEAMTIERQDALVSALKKLCERPLAHPAIARALASGVEGNVPYVVHAALPGVPVTEYLAAHGPRPLSEVALRVTQLASAVDFADASGVHHGALGPRDIAFLPESSAISGFGLAQAVKAAGIDTNEPSLADDIYALGAMAFELLAGRRFDGGPIRAALAGLPDLSAPRLDALARALESALSPDMRLWPNTAGQLADSLARAAPPTSGVPPTRAHTLASDPAVGRLAFAPEDAFASEVTIPARRPVPAHPPDVPRAPLELSLFDTPPAEGARGTAPDPDITLAGRAAASSGRPARELFQPHAAEETDSRDRRRWPLLAMAIGAVAIVALVVGTWLLRGSNVPAPPPQDIATRETVAASTPLPETETPADAQAPQGTAPVVPVPAPTLTPAPQPPSIAPPVTPATERENVPTPPRRQPAPQPGSPIAPTPTPTPTPPTTGRVLVRSTPAGAQVAIDGQPRGQTPLAVRDLELGAHTITVTGVGIRPWETRVTLTAERPALNLEAGIDAGHDVASSPGSSREAGVLQVDSRPSGARVFLDGERVGITPLSLRDVRQGSHVVRLELPGYRVWTTRVDLAAGARQRVAASLEP
jgi:hypothetical protein